MSAPGGGVPGPGAGGGVPFLLAAIAVGPQLHAFWQANNAFNGARSMANLNAAIAAGHAAVNAINANMGVLGAGGPALLNATQGTLANLQAIAAAAAALVALHLPPGGGDGGGGAGPAGGAAAAA